MAVSGLSQMKNYTSVETLEITQNLINSSRQCPSGHGFMVVLRIPCIPLAAVAYERLHHVRERLSLADNFEIILGNPNSGITIGKHFVEQLKVTCRMTLPEKNLWGALLSVGGWYKIFIACDLNVCGGDGHFPAKLKFSMEPHSYLSDTSISHSYSQPLWWLLRRAFTNVIRTPR